MRLQDAPVLYTSTGPVQKVYYNNAVLGNWVDRRNVMINPGGGNSAWWETNASASRASTAGFAGQDYAMRFTRTAVGAIRMAGRFSANDWLPSTNYIARMMLRSSEAITSGTTIALRPLTSSGTGQGNIVNITIPAGISELIVPLTTSSASGAAVTLPGFAIIPTIGIGSMGWTLDITAAHLEPAATWNGQYFDGTKADLPGEDNAWVGTANASASTQRKWTWN